MNNNFDKKAGDFTLGIAFVVLHYKTADDTIKCVESLLSSQDPDNCRIVIVDNGSGNSSDVVLRKKYGKHPKIDLVISDKNLGFACGMNLGISSLKNNGWNDFIVLLNNDTIITQSGWERIINQKYQQYHFGVLGPDIVDLTGRHANPFHHIEMSAKSIRQNINYYNRNYFKEFFCLGQGRFSLWQILEKTARGIKQKIFGACNNGQTDCFQYETEEQCDKENVSLQGSCIILSPLYFDYYDGLYPKTFLYYEEAVLRLRCEIAHLASVYTPDLKILHLDGVATKDIIKDNRNRNLFFYSNCVKSLKQIRTDVVKYEKNHTRF